MPSPATVFAREIRRNPTDAERTLWAHLRRRQLGGHRFRRQVSLGRYTVDFVCLERNLVVELDGSQHAGRQIGHDRVRDDYLERRGFHVLRFWNSDVFNRLDSVMEAIWSELHAGRSQIALAPLRPSGTSPLRGKD